MTEREWLAAMTLDDYRGLVHVLAPSFGIAPDRWMSFLDQVGLENFRALRVGGRIVAGAGFHPAGQFFGGRALRMAGFAGVGTSAADRAGGFAADLLTRMLRDVRAQGYPLAGLYPASHRVYRKVGFELAGSRTLWQVPLARLTSGEHALPMHRIEPDDLATFAPIYATHALSRNGALQRTPGLWSRVYRRAENDLYGWILGAPADPEGFCILTHRSGAGAHHDVILRDFAVNTPAASRRLWTFLADHRSVGDRVEYAGPAIDPWHLHLSENLAVCAGREPWMLRIVDVAAALEGRGFPPEVELALALGVTDETLPENNATYTMRVSAGRASVTRGGEADLRLTARALAPLFSGYHSATTLAGLGLIEGAPPALSRADRLFSGPEPWMRDMY